MSSREVILGRIRSALDGSPPAAPVVREYRRGAGIADLDLLVERLTDYKAVVHRGSDIASLVASILDDADRSAYPDASPGDEPDRSAYSYAASRRPRLVVPPGIDPTWLPEAVEAVRDDDLDQATIAAADGVLTAATVVVAETGTIVLDASPDQGRRVISLLPDLHICVIRPDQVVASVPEALARLDPRRPLTWISGPSATSDIELNRVEGVHGPRRLHVIVTEAPDD
jgi:L-lactate dehydrogenase complex protein LldG